MERSHRYLAAISDRGRRGPVIQHARELYHRDLYGFPDENICRECQECNSLFWALPRGPLTTK